MWPQGQHKRGMDIYTQAC